MRGVKKARGAGPKGSGNRVNAGLPPIAGGGGTGLQGSAPTLGRVTNLFGPSEPFGALLIIVTRMLNAAAA